MPRPDSKILQSALGGTGVGDASVEPSNADALVSKSRAKRIAVQSGVTDVTAKPAKLSAEEKAAQKEAAAKAAAELKQKKIDLTTALKQAREPLTTAGNDLKALDKASDAASKAHVKAMAAFEKTRAALVAKQAKYAAAFEKTEVKINAQLAKLG